MLHDDHERWFLSSFSLLVKYCKFVFVYETTSVVKHLVFAAMSNTGRGVLVSQRFLVGVGTIKRRGR